jgi:hypothetical protein
LSNQPGILKDKNAFLGQMGLKYVWSDRYGNVVDAGNHSYTSATDVPQRISGFDYGYQGDLKPAQTKPILIAPVPERCEASLLPGKRVLHLTAGNRTLIDIDLNPMVDSLAKTYTETWNAGIPPEKMYLERQAGGYTIGLQVRHVYLYPNNPGFGTLTAGIYVKLPKGTAPGSRPAPGSVIP